MPLIEMRTATITEKGQVAIPKELRDSKEFKEGAKVIILAFSDRIELRPMKQISDKLFAAIASEKSLAKNWLSREDEKAWKDL